MNPSASLAFFFSAALAFAGAAPAIFAQADAPRSESATTAVAPLFSREQLLAEVGLQLTEHFHAEGELQLELLRPWTAVSATSVVVAEFPSALTSSLLVRVHFVNAAQAVSDVTLPLHAQLLRDAWVTRQPVERNAVFDSAQLDTRRVDVLREHEAISLTDAQTDFAYARPVPAGRVLTWHDVMRRALVRKGEVIEVAAVDGALTVTMKALAMENGAAGETVKVRNLVTKKEFPALVVADSKAQVRF